MISQMAWGGGGGEEEDSCYLGFLGNEESRFLWSLLPPLGAKRRRRRQKKIREIACCMCVGGGDDVVVMEVTACCQSVCSIVRQCKLSGSSKNYFIKLVCSVCKVLFVLAFLASFPSFCLDTRQCNFAAAATNLGQRKEVDCWGKKRKEDLVLRAHLCTFARWTFYQNTHAWKCERQKKICLRKCFTLQARPVALGRGRGRMQTFFLLLPSNNGLFFIMCSIQGRLWGEGGGGVAAAKAEEGYKTKLFRSTEKRGKILFSPGLFFLDVQI